MIAHTFFIVDVFAETKYAGNQLAVLIDPGDLSSADMQNIARETHFSETTFVSPEANREGSYDVRIFTPGTELPFAGHPTLGTAFVVSHQVARTAPATVVLNERAGPIPVTCADDVWWMKQNAPTFGESIDPHIGAETLSLTREDVDDRFPMQFVSTGLPFLIAPLKTLAAVKRAQPNWTKFVSSGRPITPRAILLFCPETYDGRNQLNARVFVEGYGIVEDPATGSGNGCLAAYLVRHRYFGRPQVDIRVEQGYEIARPSLLFLKAFEEGGTIQVNVGGRVVLVAKGEFV